MTLRMLIPATRLGRTRVVMLIFGIIFMLLAFGQLDTSSGAFPFSVLALVAQIGLLLATAWRGRHLSIAEAPATAALAVLMGISMHSPLSSIGISIGVIMSQTLYDRPLNSLLRIFSFIPVIPLTAALSMSTGERPAWNSPAVLGPVIIIPLYLALVIMLKGALESQGQSLVRARFLSRVTGDLLTALNPAMVGGILAAATDDLCRLIPGLVGVPIYRGEKDGPATILAIHGVRGEAEPGEIPMELLTSADRLHRFELGELDGITGAMAALGLPDHRTWHAISMGLPPAVAKATGLDTMLWGLPIGAGERFLGVAGTGTAESLELLRTLNQHGQVAFDAAVERIELLDRTGRDLSTGLPNRDTMMARMIQFVDDDAEPCALVLVGFDGMRDITLEHGLNGRVRVSRQLAERIVAVQEDLDPDAFAARLADDVIALVLPGQPGLAAEAIARMRERLAEPMLLDGAPVRCGITFGTADPEDGSSAFELIDAATMRLLSASVRVGPLAGMRSEQA